MKRVLKILSLLVFVVPMIAATTMYLATEKKYAFTAENLAATIPEFVEDENKQIEMAKKWVELADPDTGMLSIADIFSTCRAGGFNTYRVAGFESCRAFIVKLLENAEGELDEDFLNGYCPGLDENGKNPNALSTITDKTRIGGHCSSKNIYAGEVTFRKGYNCTCTAYACNNGYELKKGQCVTLVADGQGNCLRKEFPKTDKVNTMAKAVEFCQDYATKNKCKYTNAIIYHSKSQIVCNAEIGEVDNVKAGMLENQDRKIASLKYYEVCGQHRGKTGKTEHCVDSLFKDVDVGLNEAAGLAQLYAKKNHGKTIYCDTKYRSVSNDDYIKCATLDKDVYYEFKFDDVIETNDATKFKNTVRGISLIYGGNWNGYNISGNCTQSLKNAAKKFGMKTNERYGVCVFEYGKKIESKDMANGLRTIDGIDNYIAKQIQVRGSVELRNQLKSYVQSQGFFVTGFDCDNSYGRVKNSWLTGDEDILTCRLSGSKNGVRYTNQPIDFVFDDVSEGKKNTREAGAQGMQCIVGNGKFDGHYCRGLTRDECFQLEREMRKQGIKSWDGSVDLVDWDESAGACELNSAQFANNMNKTGKYVAIAGLTIGGAVTGGASTTLAISLMAVELAGMAGEIYTDRKQELLPQQWANEFLAASIVCKNSSCAETTLRKNFAKISQASDMLNRDVLSAVDTELARLAEMIPQERVEQIMNSGEKPSCWDTWECQRWIFTGMQFASLGVGIGKGLVKLTGVFSKKAAAAATKTSAKAATSTASHIDDLQDMMKLSAEEFSRKYSSRFADIGIKEERTAAGGFRYRDTKTGQFVSRENVGRRLRGEQDVPGGGAGGTGNTGNTSGSSGNGSGGSGNPGGTNNGGGSGGGTAGGATGGASNGTPPGSGSTGPHGGNGGSGGTSGSSGSTGGSNGAGHSGSGNTGGSGSTGGSGNTGPHNNTGGQGASGNTGNTGPSGTGGTGRSSGNASGGNSGSHNNGGSGGSTSGNTGGTSGGNTSGSSGNGGASGSGHSGSGNTGPHNNTGGQGASGNTGNTSGNGSGNSGSTNGTSHTSGSTGGGASGAFNPHTDYNPNVAALDKDAVLSKWGLGGVDDKAVIKKRYRELSMAFHPDRYGDAGNDVMQIINNEADVLREAGLL